MNNNQTLDKTARGQAEEVSRRAGSKPADWMTLAGISGKGAKQKVTSSGNIKNEER